MKGNSKLTLADVRQLGGIEDHPCVLELGSLEDVKAQAGEAPRELAELEGELDAAFEADVAAAARGEPMRTVAAVRRRIDEAREHAEVMQRAVEAAQLARRKAIAEARAEILSVLRAEARAPLQELEDGLRRLGAGPNHRVLEMWRIAQRLGVQFPQVHWHELLSAEESDGQGSRVNAWAGYVRECGLGDGSRRDDG